MTQNLVAYRVTGCALWDFNQAAHMGSYLSIHS